jgi:hypothetical protein
MEATRPPYRAARVLKRRRIGADSEQRATLVPRGRRRRPATGGRPGALARDTRRQQGSLDNGGVDYLKALHYNARREDPDRLRAMLADLESARGQAETPKRRRQLDRQARALRQRLRVAEALREYDWEAGEAAFVEFVRGVVNVPGVYERWRAHGVPVHVLRRAGFRVSSPTTTRELPR